MGSIADKLTYLNDTKIAIKEAIVAKGITVSDNDTFRSYATKIGDISGGGAPVTKYGLTINNFMGDVIDGRLSPAPMGNLVLTGVTKIVSGDIPTAWFQGRTNSFTFSAPDLTFIDNNGLSQIFQTSHITSASFPVLTTIANSGLYRTFYNSSIESIEVPELTSCYGFSQACYGASSLVSFSAPKLQTFEGVNNAFYNCTSLQTLSLPSLKSITTSWMGMCHGCSSLTTIDLSGLTKVSGTNLLNNTFQGCTSLTRIDFPALTTISGTNPFGTSSGYMFNGCDALNEIHFREDMEEVVLNIAGQDNRWGAYNAQILFDLPATDA